MKLFITTLFILGTFSAFSQITKTVHYAFEFKDANSLDMTGLNGEVTVKERGGSRVLVEMNISVENGSGIILDDWIKKGRYDIDMQIKGAVAYIFSKHIITEKDIIKRGNPGIEGVPMIEKLSYIVYVPPPFIHLVQLIGNTKLEEEIIKD